MGRRICTTVSTNGASLPKPGAFILQDVRMWRDVIRRRTFPVRLEKIAKDPLESAKVNREATAVDFYLHFGYFQLLMSFMGFEEGMFALYDEPEECSPAGLSCNFYLTIAEKMID
jgi:hypothetical protein